MYLNFHVNAIISLTRNVKPGHEMYLNRLIFNPKSRDVLVKPGHEMYLNLIISSVNGSLVSMLNQDMRCI